jgi:hypothetical protein
MQNEISICGSAKPAESKNAPQLDDEFARLHLLIWTLITSVGKKLADWVASTSQHDSHTECAVKKPRIIKTRGFFLYARLHCFIRISILYELPNIT